MGRRPGAVEALVRRPARHRADAVRRTLLQVRRARLPDSRPVQPGQGRGGTGVWFEVDDVDAAYDELRGRGYAFNSEPFDIPPGRLVTLNDPDGNTIGLIDNSRGGMPGQTYP